MFDFEKLDVYGHMRDLNREVLNYILESQRVDKHIGEEWKCATVAIVANLSEGTARAIKADKRNYYIAARSSVSQCVALLNTVKDVKQIPDSLYDEYYEKYERISKMMLGMIRNAQASLVSEDDSEYMRGGGDGSRTGDPR